MQTRVPFILASFSLRSIKIAFRGNSRLKKVNCTFVIVILNKLRVVRNDDVDLMQPICVSVSELPVGVTL